MPLHRSPERCGRHGPPRGPARRTVVAALAATAAGAALAGCSGGRPSGSMSATWYGDPGLNTAMGAALRLYRERNPGPEFRAEFLPWDGYWDKLATRSAGGETPDLVMQAATYLPEYVGRGALLDLDPYVGSALDLDPVDPGARTTGRHRGSTYAAVAAVNALTLIANRDLLARHDVELPDDTTWDWDALHAHAADVHRRSHGRVYGVHDGGGDLMMFQVYVRQHGAELFDADGRPGFPRSLLVRWFSYWHALRADGAAPPPDMTAESAGMQAQSPLVRRRAAATFGWTQDIPLYGGLLPDRLEARLPPRTAADRPGLWPNAASLWAASAQTRRPDDVVALIDFLLNDPAAADALGLRLGVPPRRDRRARMRDGADPLTRIALDYMDRVTEHSTPLPRVWPLGFTALRDDFPRLNEDVGFALRSPEDAARAFFTRAAEAVG